MRSARTRPVFVGAPLVARALELHWPTLLVLAACFGLVLSNLATVAPVACAGVALVALGGVLAFDGPARLAALSLALCAVGVWWGSLRTEAVAVSVLSSEIGTSGSAEVVVTGASRASEWGLRVQGELLRYRGAQLRERILLTLPLGRSPPRGTILATVVRLVEPRPPSDGFDEGAWLARQGIHVVARGGAWRPLGRRGGVAGLGDRVRDRVEVANGRGSDSTRRGVVLGVVLGEDEGLPRDVQEAFRASGLYHLLAVSGQNVAFIVGGAFGIGWLLRLPRVLREVLALGGIGGYVLAVGWQPSVVRAGIAGALASFAWLVARPRDRWHFMAVGALVLLAWSPATVFEPGFQLSFTAVAAIFVGVPGARRLAEGLPVPQGGVDAVAVALVCGVATAPIVLMHFGQAPVYTVPANALAAPAMPLVLGLGLLAGVVDPLSPGAASALAWLAGWAAWWLELVAKMFASLPGAQVGTLQAFVAAGLIGGLWVAVRAGRHRSGTALPKVALLVAPMVAVVGVTSWSLVHRPASWSPPAGLRVTFLDVGQGDAVLLETSTARILVDQGPPEADVAGQLLGMGIRTLTALVLTHPQRDHIGGAADVIRRLGVGAVLDPALVVTGPEREEAIAVARARGVPVRVLRGGTTVRAGGLAVRALWPRDGGREGEDPNRNAVVLLASYGESDVLLPADAESDVTSHLDIGDVEVLKVAHHGSEDLGLASELKRLRPEIAVISAGRGNEYGHPRPETLAALETLPALSVLRTDVDGRVVVESDGRLLRVWSAG